MIEKDKKTIAVTVSVPHMNSIVSYKAELVPYFNKISKERDPMIRPIENKARFLHLSTVKAAYTFEDESGHKFGLRDVMDKLYNEDNRGGG